VKPWQKAAVQSCMCGLAGVAALVWGLALLGAPPVALPFVAGVGGVFVAYSLSPAWLPPCRRRWRRRWQMDEQERQRRWEKRLQDWQGSRPPR
jgi:hypothetical protein